MSLRLEAGVVLVQSIKLNTGWEAIPFQLGVLRLEGFRLIVCGVALLAVSGSAEALDFSTECGARDLVSFPINFMERFPFPRRHQKLHVYFEIGKLKRALDDTYAEEKTLVGLMGCKEVLAEVSWHFEG
jgi:hypothetical protein